MIGLVEGKRSILRVFPTRQRREDFEGFSKLLLGILKMALLLFSVRFQSQVFRLTKTLCSSFSSHSSELIDISNGMQISAGSKKPCAFSWFSSFLVDGLGLSQSQLSIVKRLYPTMFRPTKRAQQALEIFREYGFTDLQIKNVIIKYPSILSYRTDERLRPKLEILKSIGFSTQGLAHAVLRAPRTLAVKNLDSSVEYFKCFFRGSTNLHKAIKKSPHLLQSNIDTANKQITLLRECGFSEEWIFYIICKYPMILHRCEKSTRVRMEDLRRLGFADKLKSFGFLLVSCITQSLANIENKLKMFAALGLSDGQVRKLVLRYPMLLLYSSHKVRKTADYLLEIGVPLDLICKEPFVLALSLEKRIKPRHDLFRFMRASSSFEEAPPILQFLTMSEKLFLQRYVDNSPERLKLLAILGERNQESAKVGICTLVKGKDLGSKGNGEAENCGICLE